MALHSFVGKVFARVLVNRIRNQTERVLIETQYGLKLDRGSTRCLKGNVLNNDIVV